MAVFTNGVYEVGLGNVTPLTACQLESGFSVPAPAFRDAPFFPVARRTGRSLLGVVFRPLVFGTLEDRAFSTLKKHC
jgi:hypothetical protein